MILGIGIDIVKNKRIENIINKFDLKFKNRCFTKKEIENSEKMTTNVNSYAKKFAAKEACAKALGIGLSHGIGWKDMEVSSDKFGKPLIKLHNKALNIIKNKLKISYKIQLSLSDEEDYSIANVIIYRDEK